MLRYVRRLRPPVQLLLVLRPFRLTRPSRSVFVMWCTTAEASARFHRRSTSRLKASWRPRLTTTTTSTTTSTTAALVCCLVYDPGNDEPSVKRHRFCSSLARGANVVPAELLAFLVAPPGTVAPLGGEQLPAQAPSSTMRRERGQVFEPTRLSVKLLSS
jgi:hypothetical protein